MRLNKQNLQNQQNQLLANIKGEQAQADIDSRAATSIVDSLVEFSDTLGKVAAERTKQMIEAQLEEGRRAALESAPGVRAEFERGENALIDGSIAMIGEVADDSVRSNTDQP